VEWSQIIKGMNRCKKILRETISKDQEINELEKDMIFYNV